MEAYDAVAALDAEEGIGVVARLPQPTTIKIKTIADAALQTLIVEGVHRELQDREAVAAPAIAQAVGIGPRNSNVTAIDSKRTASLNGSRRQVEGVFGVNGQEKRDRRITEGGGTVGYQVDAGAIKSAISQKSRLALAEGIVDVPVGTQAVIRKVGVAYGVGGLGIQVR